MKKSELMESIAKGCAVCGKKVLAEAKLPLFYRVTIERIFVKVEAARRSDALVSLIGSEAIADAMGPDEDLAQLVHEPVRVVVCEACGMHETSVAQLNEAAA